MILGITLVITHIIAFYAGFVYRFNYIEKVAKKSGSFAERYAVSKLQKKKKRNHTLN